MSHPWYGDTVFNYLQAAQFLEEWRQIAAADLAWNQELADVLRGLLGDM